MNAQSSTHSFGQFEFTENSPVMSSLNFQGGRPPHNFWFGQSYHEWLAFNSGYGLAGQLPTLPLSSLNYPSTSWPTNNFSQNASLSNLVNLGLGLVSSRSFASPTIISNQASIPNQNFIANSAYAYSEGYEEYSHTSTYRQNCISVGSPYLNIPSASDFTNNFSQPFSSNNPMNSMDNVGTSNSLRNSAPPTAKIDDGKANSSSMPLSLDMKEFPPLTKQEGEDAFQNNYVGCGQYGCTSPYKQSLLFGGRTKFVGESTKRDAGTAKLDGGAAAKPDSRAAKPDGGAAKPDSRAAKPDGGAAKPDGRVAKLDCGSAQSFLTPQSLNLIEFPPLNNNECQDVATNLGLENAEYSKKIGNKANLSPYKQSLLLGGIPKQEEPSEKIEKILSYNEEFPELPSLQSQAMKQKIDVPNKVNCGMLDISTESLTNIKTFEQIEKTDLTKRTCYTSDTMLKDQFGIAGLVALDLRDQSDGDARSLVRGMDLTTLGIDMNSPEYVYPTFGGPFSNEPCRPQYNDVHAPPEYLINCQIREQLSPMKLSNYTDDLVFFIFYTYEGEMYQLASAYELYIRGWRYHKEEKAWISRSIEMHPTKKTSSYEIGLYCIFDPAQWKTVVKEIFLEYDKLEGRPPKPNLVMSQ